MIERHWNADLLAKIFGFAFILVGIVGFIPNPLISETGFFQVNEAHNLIHIVTGLLFLAGAYFDASVWTIRAIAVLYTIVAIIGFAIPRQYAVRRRRDERGRPLAPCRIRGGPAAGRIRDARA